MPEDDLKRLKATFSRAALLEFAESKGVKYDSVTNRSPTRGEILAELKKRAAESHDELLKILDLRRGLREWILSAKAKELGVYREGLSRLALATRIYARSPKALEDLYNFQRAEPKRSTFGYSSKKGLSDDRLKKVMETLPEIVEEKLSEPDKGTIATVDSISEVAGELRFVVSIDRKKRTVERPRSPKFPGRKGTHDDYPLKRIVGTYNKTSRVFRVSALKDVAEKVVGCFSEAAFDSPEGFSKEIPDVRKASSLFSTDSLRNEMEKKGIRVTELELRELPLEGSPSKLVVQGDDLMKTIMQLDEAGIRLIGENLSRIVRISLSFDGKRIEVNMTRGNLGEVGKLTEEQKRELSGFLKRWGVLTEIY